MINNIGAVRRQLQASARRYDNRAEESSTPALREYYRGRAEEARAAASAVRRLEAENEDLDPTDVINRHSSHSE